jgi:hypothetical protein
VQRAGEVVYLPAGWAHSTLNVGETIAIGEQRSFAARDRYAMAKRTLDSINNTDNYKALKDFSLGRAHIAIERFDDLKLLVNKHGQFEKSFKEFRRFLVGDLQQKRNRFFFSAKIRSN